MATDQLDLAFMDTETLGLDPCAPIWEFACIRRFPNDHSYNVQMFIEHDPSYWIENMPTQFFNDYIARYDAKAAIPEREAADVIYEMTNRACIVGAVPDFDTTRIAKLLRRNGIQPSWHYHLLDVENLAIGWLRGHGMKIDPPWKSDAISLQIGVNPADFDRHTAMGDVLWVKAQYDRIMNDSLKYRGSRGICDVS